MSGNPWIRFFPSDWLAGTRGMTPSEVGIYITLIALLYERGGKIENNPARLSRLCGASNSGFKRALKTLIDEGKIVEEESYLSNIRVLEELSYTQNRSTLARDSANRRWGENVKVINGGGDANAMRTQCDGNAVPDANQKPEAIKKKKDISPKRKKRISYPDDFNSFWQAYPTDANMSKKEAWQEWGRLDDEDKTTAFESLKAFNAYCNKHSDYRAIHANRYLKHRRFDGHAEAGKEIAERQKKSKVHLVKGTPPFDAWNAYKALRGERPISRKEWWFPTEWPPGHENRA